MAWDDGLLGARASRPHQAWHSLAHLPHLDQTGTAPWLSFGLADAVPADRVAACSIALKLSGGQRHRMRAGRPRSQAMPSRRCGGGKGKAPTPDEHWKEQNRDACMDVLEAGRQALVGPPPHQPWPGGSASATPPREGSDWSVDSGREAGGAAVIRGMFRGGWGGSGRCGPELKRTAARSRPRSGTLFRKPAPGTRRTDPKGCW